jgi:hypothetical protein
MINRRWIITVLVLSLCFVALLATSSKARPVMCNEACAEKAVEAGDAAFQRCIDSFGELGNTDTAQTWCDNDRNAAKCNYINSHHCGDGCSAATSCTNQ